MRAQNQLATGCNQAHEIQSIFDRVQLTPKPNKNQI